MGCFELLEAILEALPLGFKVRNRSDELINPCTEETGVDILEKMDVLATEETLGSVKTSIDTLGTEGTLATETTLGSVKTSIDTLATETTLGLLKEEVSSIKETINTGVHDTFYTYYEAGEAADLDETGTVLSELGFYINKTMVGNVGGTQVTVTLDSGSPISLPAAASLELTHINKSTITLKGSGAGHVVWVAQGMTEKAPPNYIEPPDNNRGYIFIGDPENGGGL
ncbi:MAG: hypothetical protein Q8M92_03800 [Candidatus Subteraquimicrobiales bacterium]|nr:hypothetical protein [Candidatus Subteraquimicrobiales bacterium]